MFLVNYVLATPLYIEELDGKLGLFEREAELQSREKRDIVEGLRSLCPGKHRVLSKTSTWMCTNLALLQNWRYRSESQCDSHSLVCLPSITRFGFPKCKPVYRLKQILHNDQRKIVKLNTGCFIYLFIFLSPFYWAGFVAQRERAQQDSKVPYKTSPTPHSHTKDSHSTGITLLLFE